MRWIDYRGKHIFAYADTHGKDYRLPDDADIIVCVGDLGIYTEEDCSACMKPLAESQCPLILFVPGNHDLFFDFERKRALELLPPNVHLLEGEYVYERIHFYSLSAVPWLHRSEQLPSGLDVLVTHAPPKGYLDEGLGCPLLLEAIRDNPPKIHLFGHIHGTTGEVYDPKLRTRFVNVSSYELLD